jgi:hypothetical protein
MSSRIALDAHEITRTHDLATHHWHDPAPHFPAEHGEEHPVDSYDGFVEPSDPLMISIVAQHRANFDLWHQEDMARDMGATAENIATVKHAIDALNQRRNDLVEDIDAALLCALPYQDPSVPLNSEPPGLIIDRLSILALKIYHTREEAMRDTATNAHRHRNLERLSVLEEQRRDLADCLDALWKQVLAGERRFKLYRQMKMYNDPQLNPVLYRQERTKKGC